MIEFVNVSKIYAGITALDDLSFEIEEGEFTFLVGPSGSGKTTIIKLLIKEEIPSSGKIYFYDTDITILKGTQISQLRREVGVVFQDFKLLPNKNLYENVAFAMEVSDKKHKDIEETVNYVLELVGLADRAESFPKEISGGEKQKIALARAIANNPKVLIADEPTGNLDPKASWEIIDLLTRINQWGTTVIMATHGSDIVNTLGKRVIELERGKITSDNKKGSYPQAPIPVEKPPTQEKEEKIFPKKAQKKEKKTEPPKEKEKPKSKKKKPRQKDFPEEKEFEITFTTKEGIPPAKSKKKKIKKTTSTSTKKKKRRGKDVVDLYKLKLSDKTQEALIKADVASIKKLRKLSEEELAKTDGLGTAEIAEILKALEKSS